MRLVIADESPVFTRGLSYLLPMIIGRPVDVVATTDDASAVAATVARHDPDLAVVSLGLAEPGGVRDRRDASRQPAGARGRDGRARSRGPASARPAQRRHRLPGQDRPAGGTGIGAHRRRERLDGDPAPG